MGIVVVPSLVAEWGRRAGGSVAVSGVGGVLSYGELVERADGLARWLVGRGVRRGEVVGVCMGRGVDVVVALLGVMRAGCAYLPLDPGHPGERSGFMVSDSGARFVVVDGGVSGGVVAELGRVAELVEVSAVGGVGGVALPEVGSGDLAYVIYTSGSTGAPKGVAVEHGSVARLFDRVGEWIDWSSDDVWSCFHSVAFDFSVWEIWGALTSGGRVEIVSYEDSRDPVVFRRLLGERGVTMVSLTPSALLRLAGEGVPGRHVVLGGEAVRAGQIAGLLERVDRPRVWNLYGITETTVHASVRELTAADVGGSGSPIGVPLGDLVFAVVGAGLGEVAGGAVVEGVPVGGSGELWISGAGVARGYVNRPELTRGRFVDAVVGGVSGRWYRTGDEVRVSAAEFEFVGRLDRQVQLRGFRIELGEVEAALSARDGVGVAVVELVDGGVGPELAAFVTVAAGAGVDPGVAVGTVQDVREWLSGRLPEYMVPSSISVIDALPVTSNGKLDRAALRGMDAQSLPTRGSDAAPLTDTERLLAGIWSDVLHTTPINRNDHFFTIGGNSMTALGVSLAAEEKGLALSVRDLFMYPVLAELAAATAPTARIADPPPAVVDPMPTAVERSYPALLIQTGMLFESERDPDRPTYHVVSETTFDVSGLTRPALAAALSAVTDAQPGLRTEFDLTGVDGPVQLVHDLPDPLLEYDDLSTLAPDAAQKRIEQIRENERGRPFYRDDFPLWRLVCAVLPGGRARVFLSHHHALLDGWSVAVFFDQLRAALSGAAVATPTDVCELAAEAEAEALASTDSAEYWSDIIRQWRALAVPTRRREDGEPAVWSVAYSIDGRLRQDIDRACATWRCSPKQLFLAAHLRALELVAGPDAPRPGTLAVANARPEALDTHLAVGVFLNAVPVLPAAEDASWHERVAQVGAAELDMLEHRHFPFAAMRSRLGLPAPTTWFTYTDFAETSMSDFIATVTDYTVTELPITVSVVDDGVVVDGSSDHFTAAEVAEIVDRYVECLREAVGAVSAQ
ncbi:amino acid adenylation domain-containing protein [Micromonospora sp. CPCC 205558]|uniref:amino acid adenylation domain-containing protein n=1 Tax=Micromonospora sp. CPCC 205558 TaxID=3122403 RepID=UPI002FF32EB3